MSNAEKFDQAVKTAMAARREPAGDLRSQLSGHRVDGVPVQVRVTEPVTQELAATVELAPPENRPGRRTAGATKADMIRQAYAERTDEMVKTASGEDKREPIEVWLTRRNIGITCRVIHEDESADELEVDSLSMRGAQREITAYFKAQGYEPVSRWETEYENARDGSEETVRRFRDAQPKPASAPKPPRPAAPKPAVPVPAGVGERYIGIVTLDGVVHDCAHAATNGHMEVANAETCAKRLLRNYPGGTTGTRLHPVRRDRSGRRLS